MKTMYECDEGHVFLFPAIHKRIDLPTPRPGQMVGVPSNPTGYEPTITEKRCPYCHSRKLKEHIEEPVAALKIVSLISVDIAQVDEKLKDGYEVREVYAKNAVLQKKVKEEKQ